MVRALASVAVVLVVTVTACIDAPDVVTVGAPPESTPAPAAPDQTTSSPQTSGSTEAPDATPAEIDAGDPGSGDAAPVYIDPVKAKACSDAKGVYDGTTCIMTCTLASPCGDRKCPGGMPCKVTCTGQATCGKVECGSATACVIRCEGHQACNGDVKGVDRPSTEITCDGPQACNGKVYCSGDTCALTCANDGCKAGAVSCCATMCTLNGGAGTCL